MTSRAQTRRRNRGAGLNGVLVERTLELELIQAHLDEASGGRGGVALIDAPAGKGKSRLLTIAGDLARDAGMQVLGAQASELERDFPFGLALQLFEPRWLAADDGELARLLRGPARHAGQVLAGAGPSAGQSPTDVAFAAIHGFYWLCLNLLLDGEDAGEMRPIAVLVDDAQWADRPSLRLLAYLAERIADAPIALIVAIRSGERTADEQAVAALRRAAAPTTLRPGSLSREGVGDVVRSAFPHAEAAFCDACAAVTNGNPFLLSELLAQLRGDDCPPTAASAARVAEAPPESVMRAIVARLNELSPQAGLVARAVAIWGPGATPQSITRMTGLDLDAVTQGADALSAVNLFYPSAPLSFVHPLIAAAVRGAISPFHRGRMHRRAAAILMQDGAAPELVAGHLLHTTSESDDTAVEILRSAARRALVSGAPESAMRMLQRARSETTDAALDAGLLAELAEAELAADHPTAPDRLVEAMALCAPGPTRDRLTLAYGRALYAQARYAEAAEALEPLLASRDASSADAGHESTALYIAAAFFVPTLRPRAREHAQSLLARIGEAPSPAALDALAHLSAHGSLHGEHRERVAQTARLAWSGGALLHVAGIEGQSWPLLAAAMLYVGELDFALEICQAALNVARDDDSPGVFAAASWCRAWVLFELGRVNEAAADAQAALDARPDRWTRYLRSGYSVMALSHVERGELERAETALSIVDHPVAGESVHLPSLLEARARLRLAQRRFDDARDDALCAGAHLADTFGPTSPAAVPWQSTAALAYLAMGDVAAAQELATAEMERAMGADLPHLMVRNLRILGLCEGGEAGIELLARAASLAERRARGLEQVRALVDYGAALRRANRRTAAREPLRAALALAQTGGATALAQRATEELTATGVRRTRVVLSGVESLTPSERRVAEIAASGLTTRQIAESLFVTPKTVEFHLRHIYQKLDVRNRSDLAAALAPPAGGPSSDAGPTSD